MQARVGTDTLRAEKAPRVHKIDDIHTYRRDL